MSWFRWKRAGGLGRVARPLRGFVRSERGTAAAEFAVLAVPFLGIICATFETAIDYWAQCSLEAALTDAAREIYTGQFQNANGGKGKSSSDMITALRTALCTDNGKTRATMFVCNNVRLNVATAATFSGVNSTSPVSYNSSTKQNGWNASFGSYSCATANTVVRVQAAVDFPVFFNFINIGDARLPGNRRVLQAAAVFRVEPYASSGACS